MTRSFSVLCASIAFCIFSTIHIGTRKGFNSSSFKSGQSLRFKENFMMHVCKIHSSVFHMFYLVRKCLFTCSLHFGQDQEYPLLLADRPEKKKSLNKMRTNCNLILHFWVIYSFIKGVMYPKMKICWKFTHPQAIQDVDEFVLSPEQIWRNVALHHLLTNGSSAVNGCRQNESPNSW